MNQEDQGLTASRVSDDGRVKSSGGGSEHLGLPALPAHVSPDGREIWDWADRFSKHTQRLDEMRRLRADISGIGRGCGDCNKWMKSRECPREHNVNGMTRGPSMGALICNQYVEEPRATRRREELKGRLAGLVGEAAEHQPRDPPAASDKSREGQ